MVQEAPPTIAEAGIDTDVEKILADATAGAQRLIKEPTERWKERSNLITNDGVELPERVRVWRTLSGREAWLPTAQLRQHMAKKHPNGQKVFSATPIASSETYIDKTCDICLQRQVNKRFVSEYDYEGHMVSYHPREWDTIIRQQEREERREERELLRQLVVGGKAAPEASLSAVQVKCEDCEYAGNANQVRMHRIGKHKEVKVG